MTLLLLDGQYPTELLRPGSSSFRWLPCTTTSQKTHVFHVLSRFPPAEQFPIFICSAGGGGGGGGVDNCFVTGLGRRATFVSWAEVLSNPLFSLLARPPSLLDRVTANRKFVMETQWRRYTESERYIGLPDVLDAQCNRLIVVSGPPGIGKTWYCAHVLDLAPNSVYVCNPDDEPMLDKRELVERVLACRSSFVLLDNGEGFAEGGRLNPLVDILLSETKCRVLITVNNVYERCFFRLRLRKEMVIVEARPPLPSQVASLFFSTLSATEIDNDRIEKLVVNAGGDARRALLSYDFGLGLFDYSSSSSVSSPAVSSSSVRLLPSNNGSIDGDRLATAILCAGGDVQRSVAFYESESELSSSSDAVIDRLRLDVAILRSGGNVERAVTGYRFGSNQQSAEDVDEACLSKSNQSMLIRVSNLFNETSLNVDRRKLHRTRAAHVLIMDDAELATDFMAENFISRLGSFSCSSSVPRAKSPSSSSSSSSSFSSDPKKVSSANLFETLHKMRILAKAADSFVAADLLNSRKGIDTSAYYADALTRQVQVAIGCTEVAPLAWAAQMPPFQETRFPYSADNRKPKTYEKRLSAISVAAFRHQLATLQHSNCLRADNVPCEPSASLLNHLRGSAYLEARERLVACLRLAYYANAANSNANNLAMRLLSYGLSDNQVREHLVQALRIATVPAVAPRRNGYHQARPMAPPSLVALHHNYVSPTLKELNSVVGALIKDAEWRLPWEDTEKTAGRAGRSGQKRPRLPSVADEDEVDDDDHMM